MSIDQVRPVSLLKPGDGITFSLLTASARVNNQEEAADAD